MIDQSPFGRQRWTTYGSAIALFCSSRAFAAARPCATGDSGLVCRLDSVLNLLYVLAAILGLLLTVAIWAAVKAYRRRQAERSVIP